MKKLFATLALSIFALSIVSCNDTKKTDDQILFSADKSEASSGDRITFTLSGPIEGINWGICDWINCKTVTFTNNKYVYEVPSYTKDSTFEYNFYALNLKAQEKSNYVPIKINLKKAQ